MKVTKFIASIKESGLFFEQAKLLRVFANNSSLKPSDEFKERAFNPDSSYESIYLSGMRNRDYNISLADYSYLQFSFINARNTELRYAYYPNPFLKEDDIEIINELDEALEEGSFDFEEYSQYLSEFDVVYKIPLIRYELDIHSYILLRHPAAHFHVGLHKGNRWPVERILTPFMFSLFIAKLYYSQEWAINGDRKVKKAQVHNRFDKKMIEEKNRCEILSEEYFNEIEKKHLFIG